MNRHDSMIHDSTLSSFERDSFMLMCSFEILIVWFSVHRWRTSSVGYERRFLVQPLHSIPIRTSCYHLDLIIKGMDLIENVFSCLVCAVCIICYKPFGTIHTSKVAVEAAFNNEFNSFYFWKTTERIFLRLYYIWMQNIVTENKLQFLI